MFHVPGFIDARHICPPTFSFKSAWIFACAFQLSSTTFPCILFLPGLHFVSEKNKEKIFKRAQWPQQNRTRAFQPEKRCRRMFFYLIKKHIQKFRHFWRKKISPEKVTYIPLAPSHSVLVVFVGVRASAQGLGHCLGSALTLSVRVSDSA